MWYGRVDFSVTPPATLFTTIIWSDYVEDEMMADCQVGARGDMNAVMNNVGGGGLRGPM